MSSSEEKNPSRSSANPYAPPQGLLTENGEEPNNRLKFPLGAVYWRLMMATFILSGLLVLAPLLYVLAEGKSLFPNIFSTPISLGIFGAMVSSFALTYGLAYVRRVVHCNYIHRHTEIREQQFDFYARCMLIGTLLTISTLTAFVCCCVPISIPFYQYSAGGGVSSNTILPTTLAVLIALGAGGFIIFKLLPREDLR